jgi:hypothetical protein
MEPSSGGAGAGDGAGRGASGAGGGSGSETGAGAGGSWRRVGVLCLGCDLLRAEGRCAWRCGALPSEGSARRRTPPPDTTRPTRRTGRRSECSSFRVGSAVRPSCDGRAGFTTCGSPTSAGTGGGAGAFSSDGSSCSASSPATTMAAAFPAAFQRIRSAIQHYKPRRPGDSPPSFWKSRRCGSLGGGGRVPLLGLISVGVQPASANSSAVR